jgi:hypothetical protein
MNIFLIDADNLNSGAWIDEAFAVLAQTEGTFPVRRAYGSAENLKALADTLRAWAVRPFVNLALTKNTTDMALAVDAMELACQQPAPRLIVIGSGDADFTPLVVRLRERGIRVLCVSERSKMGREAVPAYDRVVLVGPEHAPQAAAAPDTQPSPARRTARKTAGKTADKAGTKKAETDAVVVESAAVMEAPAPKPPAKKATRKTAPRQKAPASREPADQPAVSPIAPAKPMPTAPEVTLASKPGATRASQAPVLDVAAILAAVPALQNGQQLPINVVAKALRDQKMLGQNAASPKLLGKFPDAFELLPAGKPNLVRYRLPNAS